MVLHGESSLTVPTAKPARPLVASLSVSLLTVFLLATLMLAGGCARLPPLDNRQSSLAIPAQETITTRLGGSIASRVDEHPGASGIYPLADPMDAFAARALLTEAADQSLDIQYYIWQGDTTGLLLMRSLLSAADRGIRVRLLMDDNGIRGLDRYFAVLNSHPNIEVRLFNPFVVRNPKWVNYFTDFVRINRRMHNKSFTADNQATIIGGRNIGDEYFGATDGVLFADLDVLAVGPVVVDVSNDFDLYWNSQSSYPAELILAEPSAADTEAVVNTLEQVGKSREARDYLRTLQDTNLLQALLTGQLKLEWAPTVMVSDDPAKALNRAPVTGLLSRQLLEALGSPQQRVTLVSPYLIPTGAGVELFRRLVARGVEVQILTNALEATDMAAVHAAYAKYREPLLEAGVVLYELRKVAGDAGETKGGSAPFGSSGSSLHAKTFAVDGEQLFVGSFNFDPRSTHLNTELGFVINSPVLASAIDEAFLEDVPMRAYQVKLDSRGNLYWLEQAEGRNLIHGHEPNTTLGKRVMVFLMSLLPIEPLL